jgi:hypothetical protein
MNDETPVSPHLESDLWRWLLFESGLNRRRAREIILQGAQSNALSLFWQAGPAILAQQLTLSPEESTRFQKVYADWAAYDIRFDAERRGGLQTLRINEPGYPDSLLRFLPPERRPLLLFLRGEMALWDMPTLLPVAGTQPDEEAIVWALDVLADLAMEGALPLLIAQAGFEALAVRTFITAGVPFVLLVPQGLAAYVPPAGLQQALDEGRALLVSPFQPDWRAPAEGENPMLPHAVAFAHSLAHALLALSPPAFAPAPEQPCFRWPGLTDGSSCPDVYGDAEFFFLRLAESAASGPPDVIVAAAQASAPPSAEPIDPAEILETLARGGDIPPALAQRLRNYSKAD